MMPCSLLCRLHDWLYEASKLMGEGKTYAFSIPLLPTSIMVTDPVCLEYLLKRKAHNFIKGPRFYLVRINAADQVAGLTARLSLLPQQMQTAAWPPTACRLLDFKSIVFRADPPGSGSFLCSSFVCVRSSDAAG